MNEDLVPWYKDPRGIVSAIAIATTVLGFFYIREKQMWEQSKALESIEARGAAAILEFKLQQEKMWLLLNAQQRAIWELEHAVKIKPKKVDENEGAAPY